MRRGGGGGGSVPRPGHAARPVRAGPRTHTSIEEPYDIRMELERMARLVDGGGTGRQVTSFMLRRNILGAFLGSRGGGDGAGDGADVTQEMEIPPTGI